MMIKSKLPNKRVQCKPGQARQQIGKCSNFGGEDGRWG